MRRIKVFNIVEIAVCAAVGVAAISSLPARAQIPADAVDLDRVVSFSQVRPVAMFKAYGDPNLYYILRSGLSVVLDQGATDATLLYKDRTIDRSFLSLRLLTQMESKDVSDAITEIKQSAPQARFAYIEPSSFEYIVFTPGANGGSPHVEKTPVLGDSNTELLISVDPILKRILLIPTSYQFAVLSVSAKTEISGVIRDSDGTPKMGSREVDLTTVVNGSCALLPDRYVNIDTGATGCIYPKYPKSLVLRIQKQLFRLKLIKFRPDGRFGDNTKAGIRAGQAKLNRIEDGIPSQELLEALMKV